jgi:hypothetical protein
MYSTIIFLLFVAFLILYNLSRKAKWDHKPLWAIKLASQPNYSRIISFTLLLIAGVMLILLNGVGSGLFALVVILMCMGCLTVLLFPFRYLSALQVLLIYGLMVSLETLIF